MPNRESEDAEWDARAYQPHSHIQFEWGMRLLNAISLRSDETVLDAGCGTGRLTAELLKRLPRGRVIAVDKSESMLRMAGDFLKPSFGGRVMLIQADLQHFRMKEMVDGIFSVSSFHWITDHSGLFKNMYEALRPRGWLGAQWAGAGNLAHLRRLASDLMNREIFRDYFDGWSSPWELAGKEITASRLCEVGFVDIEVSLKPSPIVLHDAEEYKSYLANLVFHHHLARMPNTCLFRFASEPFSARKVSHPSFG